MRPLAVLAAVLLAAPAVSWNVNALAQGATVAGGDIVLPGERLFFLPFHDRSNAPDSSTCTRTAPSQAACTTGDFFCYGGFGGLAFQCSGGFHHLESNAPLQHGVPEDCCQGYRGRVRSVLDHSGGQSVVQCDIMFVNITRIRTCVGPSGPAPPAGIYSARHSCTSTDFLSSAGSGSGTWQCFISHP